jgi:hypothetical protein
MSDKAFMIVGGVIGFAAWLYLIIKYYVGSPQLIAVAFIGAGVVLGYFVADLLRAIGLN